MQPAKKTEPLHFPKTISRNKYNLPINERLKKARQAKNWTLARTTEEMEKRNIKLGQSSIQGYEANENSLNHRYPSLIALYALSDLYDCSVDYILGTSETLKHTGKTDLKSRLQYEYGQTWEGQPITKAQQTMIIYAIKKIMDPPKKNKEQI
jgi:transcriptional regulator with XRE-family HTH domain